MNFSCHLILQLALVAAHVLPSYAGINSGGGLGRVGSLSSFGSIGSPFVTGLRTTGSNINRTGLVTVLVPWHTNAAFQDSDSDGMSDAWEITNGLNPNVANASDDADHDGFTDYQEFVTGTLPLLPHSRFLVGGVWESGGFRIQCATLVGRKYHIERSTNLVQWPLHEEVIGDGYMLDRIIPVPNGHLFGFYRIVVTMFRP